ncbi:insulinase family protein [Marinobacterium sp. xm-d-564]|uniref:insulinase family protein n=1 Tax=Marinobacterium sp. xm-d-564 TaxID=2497742 RepID=UPI001568B817|nr:Protease 3 precursor [Marinobacterium sp. xm-d-564]
MIKKSIVSLLFLVFLSLSSIVGADVIKSLNDTREYRILELDNQLRALLISDMQSDKGAASLNVQVGSSANPPERAGLAHFLEHMLFLGTEKYPEADAYQAFINSNGGSHNAFTAYDDTNYFFDVRAEAFPEALDRFAQFFIAPLFTEAYVDRERNAVHSEYESKRLDDGRRIYVAKKEAMNPEHNWTQFSVGNLDTLENTPENPIRPDLIDFYNRYYSANLMTLVVSAPLSLDELETLVTQRFSRVKNRNATPYSDAVPLFTENEIGREIRIKTLKESRQLTLTFPVPPREGYWKKKPLYFIANQIGYEGKGSLLSYLKDEGLADSVGAWIGIDQPEQSTFDIHIDLTLKGLEQKERVIEAVFSKFELIKQAGVQQSLFDEQALLAMNEFRFQQSSEPIHNVMRLSQMMVDYPEAELIRASYAFDQFDAALINDYLSYMTPDNLVLGLYSQEVETDQQEPRYEIDYSIKTIDSALLERWRSPKSIPALSIKPLNPYIADQFDLLEESQADIPETVFQKGNLTALHKVDVSYKQPRGAINLAILSNKAQPDAAASVANSLLTDMINEQLNEALYDAALAGLNAELYPHLRGLSIKVSGYNQRLDRLLETLLNSLSLPLQDEALFARLKQNLKEDLANSLKEKPYNRTFALLYQELLDSWSSEEKLAVIDSMTLADLSKQKESLLAEGQLKLFIHGNISREQAELISSTVHSALSEMKSVKVSPIKAKSLAEGETTKSIAVAHTDSALLLYLQADSDTAQARVETALINELLSTPFYTQLRTEQQLGYVVFSNFLPIGETPGVGLTVQSPTADSQALKQAYSDFLSGWRAGLAAELEQNIEQYRASLRSRIASPSKRLADETERLWREIDRDNLNFDTREQLLTALDNLTSEQILKRADQLLELKLWIEANPESPKS